MKIQRFFSPRFWILLPITIFVVCSFKSFPTTAHLQEQSKMPSETQATEQSLKKVENLVPKHIPLKIKFKNLESKKKMPEIEIEVTNTSDKPIYYINLWLYLTGVKSEKGNDITVPFRYGREELSDFVSEFTPEDIPLKPGETATIKIPDMDASVWEDYKVSRNKVEPMSFVLRFSRVVFSDHTGFAGFKGTPLPNKQSFNGLGGTRQGSNSSHLLAALLNGPPSFNQLPTPLLNIG